MIELKNLPPKIKTEFKEQITIVQDGITKLVDIGKKRGIRLSKDGVIQLIWGENLNDSF